MSHKKKTKKQKKSKDNDEKWKKYVTKKKDIFSTKL